MKTPVSLPCSEVGLILARSSASQVASSSSRCCGSMACASRGLMPKNAASKSATLSTNDPARTYVAPGASGSGPNNASRFQPRSVGKSETTSRPTDRSCHKSSGELTPPGKRQPIPRMAIGSLGLFPFIARSRCSVAISHRAFVRRATVTSPAIDANFSARRRRLRDKGIRRSCGWQSEAPDFFAK
jgi:hypothetical protein